MNSAKVKLVSICTDDYEIIKINEYTNKKKTFQSLPKFLIVKIIESKSLNKIQFENLSEDHFFLEPTTNSFQVSTSTNTKRNVTIRRTQFALTPSYAVTSYKLQGNTVSKLIVDLCLPKIGKIDFAYSYVALSRVRSITDLMILRPFNSNILKPKIPKDLKDEMIRLEELENKTINNYYNKL